VTYAAGGTGGSGSNTAFGGSGTANTGNGGNGSSSTTASGTYTGGTGGSGIVIVAYPDSYAAPTSVTGTFTQPTRTGYRVYRFTGSGSITL
jgi:hypothetical protein